MQFECLMELYSSLFMEPQYFKLLALSKILHVLNIIWNSQLAIRDNVCFSS